MTRRLYVSRGRSPPQFVVSPVDFWCCLQQPVFVIFGSFNSRAAACLFRRCDIAGGNDKSLELLKRHLVFSKRKSVDFQDFQFGVTPQIIVRYRRKKYECRMNQRAVFSLRCAPFQASAGMSSRKTGGFTGINSSTAASMPSSRFKTVQVAS